VKHDIQEITDVNMGDFDDSFNVAFGVMASEFNWFDNPYVSANVYEYDQEFKPNLS